MPNSLRAVRTAVCAQPFSGPLSLVEYERLVARGAAQLHTCVVYAQRFAVSRYDTMEAANDLAILLEIRVPSVCVDLLAEGGIRAVLVRVAWPADGGRFASRWHLTR